MVKFTKKNLLHLFAIGLFLGLLHSFELIAETNPIIRMMSEIEKKYNQRTDKAVTQKIEKRKRSKSI